MLRPLGRSIAQNTHFKRNIAQYIPDNSVLSHHSASPIHLGSQASRVQRTVLSEWSAISHVNCINTRIRPISSYTSQSSHKIKTSHARFISSSPSSSRLQNGRRVTRHHPNRLQYNKTNLLSTPFSHNNRIQVICKPNPVTPTSVKTAWTPTTTPPSLSLSWSRPSSSLSRSSSSHSSSSSLSTILLGIASSSTLSSYILRSAIPISAITNVAQEPHDPSHLAPDLRQVYELDRVRQLQLETIDTAKPVKQIKQSIDQDIISSNQKLDEIKANLDNEVIYFLGFDICNIFSYYIPTTWENYITKMTPLLKDAITTYLIGPQLYRIFYYIFNIVDPNKIYGYPHRFEQIEKSWGIPLTWFNFIRSGNMNIDLLLILPFIRGTIYTTSLFISEISDVFPTIRQYILQPIVWAISRTLHYHAPDIVVSDIARLSVYVEEAKQNQIIENERKEYEKTKEKRRKQIEKDQKKLQTLHQQEIYDRQKKQEQQADDQLKINEGYIQELLLRNHDELSDDDKLILSRYMSQSLDEQTIDPYAIAFNEDDAAEIGDKLIYDDYNRKSNRLNNEYSEKRQNNTPMYRHDLDDTLNPENDRYTMDEIIKRSRNAANTKSKAEIDVIKAEFNHAKAHHEYWHKPGIVVEVNGQPFDYIRPE